ncbi:hypothetical protein DL98DRAFT_528680 [Cadophora sp. DSE1049]|nr:hypothetical protein DL98DRAFT_528680 [Cadophora sp. DSE1049]
MTTTPQAQSFRIAVSKDGSLTLYADDSSSHQELQVITTNKVSGLPALVQGVCNFVCNNKKVIILCIAGATVYCNFLAPTVGWVTDSVYPTKVMAETQKVMAETQKMMVEKQRGSSNFWVWAALATACAVTTARRSLVRVASRKLHLR